MSRDLPIVSIVILCTAAGFAVGVWFAVIMGAR
jgi:hypothetical protein